jgi:acetylornithine deacetylase/succinyl-diaminopimelate desuccinylase-like protein
MSTVISFKAALESLEYLLKNGFKPKRSFYVAFGHDEEGLGVDGAQYLAKALAAKGVKRLEYLLDEGTIILNKAFVGVDALVALVGVTEKGYLTVRMTAKGEVGHSSMAPVDTAITTLAKAVSKLVLFVFCLRSDLDINCYFNFKNTGLSRQFTRICLVWDPRRTCLKPSPQPSVCVEFCE